MELEPNGDELDASYPERGRQMLSNPNEDDEDDDAAEDSDPAEPSLGSCNTSHGQTQAFWGFGGTSDREGPEDDLEPSLCGVTVEAGLDDRDLEGDDADREPSLGWPEDRVSQAAHPGNFDDRELAGGAARCVVEAARGREPTHCTADNTGRHVDIDDSRIGARRIRNLSAEQAELLAPRIDRSEVRI
jgi:hypothetical protein